MASKPNYQYMGATILFVRSNNAWEVNRGDDALHTLFGWRPRSAVIDGIEHMFQFADNLAAERCIAHFARLKKAAA